MLKLTRKFKEGFKSYDYASQDIDILLSMLDIILEMMGIVEMSDHENIKKLSSFTRLLSSGYSHTIMDAVMIEEIYATTIIPVLDHFDEKYTAKFVAISNKEIVNGIPHTEVFTNERVIEASNEFCNGKMDVEAYRRFLRQESAEYKAKVRNSENEIAVALNKLKILDNKPEVHINEDIVTLNKFITNNKDTDDPNTLEVIFNMSKDTVVILHNIYDSFTSGKLQEHREKYLNDLVELRNTMEIASLFNDTQIQLISDVIRSLCYSLIDEIKRNDIVPPSSIMLIELKFKSLEGVKYKDKVDSSL